MNTDKISAYIGREVTSYYALLADSDNTERTNVRLLAKIEALLGLLDDFHIGCEIIGNSPFYEGITINKKSYTYTIKDHALWSFCINEKIC